MTEIHEVVELELTPIPPDTVASAKADIIPYIDKILQENGQAQLLSGGELELEVEKTFPWDGVIIVGLTFLSGLAVETYKILILPKLKKRFEVKKKKQSKRKKNNK